MANAPTGFTYSSLASEEFSLWKMWWITCLFWVLTLIQDHLRIGTANKWWFVGILTLYLMMVPWRRPMPWSTTVGVTIISITFAISHFVMDRGVTPFYMLYYGVLLACSLLIFVARHYVAPIRDLPVPLRGRSRSH